jgi:hypothetical protein
MWPVANWQAMGRLGYLGEGSDGAGPFNRFLGVRGSDGVNPLTAALLSR